MFPKFKKYFKRETVEDVETTEHRNEDGRLLGCPV
jgi:hypothetical protein